MASSFFFFFFYFILLYNTVLVLPYIDMNPPRVYMSSQSWNPSHLPPHIISLDHPRAPAPSILYPVSNIAMSSSNCFFLSCIQVSQEAGQVVWYSHLFQNCPEFIVIHTVKGFGIVNKAETDVFLELSCFFNDSSDVGNLISGSSAFSKTSVNIWKFTVHVLLKPGLENFKHY